MKVICNKEIIEVNNVIATSLTLQNMINDLEINDLPIVPDEYYDQLKIELEPFENIEFRLKLLEFMKVTTELIYCDEAKKFFGQANKSDLTAKLIDDFHKRYAMLVFYDFLEVNSDAMNVLAKQSGIILEQLDSEIKIEIIPQILSMIILQHPSLCYEASTYYGIARELQPELIKKIYSYKAKYASSFCIRRTPNLSNNIKNYCYEGNYEHVKYLFDLGTKFENINGCFDYACQSGNIKLVNFIFELGGTITEKNIDEASHLQHSDVVKFLVENFKDENSLAKISTKILYDSCCKCNIELFHYSISKGADIHYHEDLLCMDSDADPDARFKIAKYLVENKYNINKNLIEYCIMDCIVDYDMKLIDYLYVNGLDVHFKDDLLLRLACKKGRYDLCEYLINKGANVHAKDEECLMNCICSTDNNNISVFKLIVDSGADINYIWKKPYNKNVKGKNEDYYQDVCDDIKLAHYVLTKDLSSCISKFRDTICNRNWSKDKKCEREKYYAKMIKYLEKRENMIINHQ